MFGLRLPTRVDGGKGHEFKTHLQPYLTKFFLKVFFWEGGLCRLEGSMGGIGGWWVEFNVLTFPLHGIN